MILAADVFDVIIFLISVLVYPISTSTVVITMVSVSIFIIKILVVYARFILG